MLSYILPSIMGNVVVFHGPLSFKMVGAIEKRIVWVPGMVLLDFEHSSAQSLLTQPKTEFSNCHFGKSVFGLHGIKIKV
jgi:hypothetical protein